MIDDTENGILKDEPNNDHRRLQQGFEALRPAFSRNDKVCTMLARTGGKMLQL
jgi:hypothetical protein